MKKDKNLKCDCTITINELNKEQVKEFQELTKCFAKKIKLKKSQLKGIARVCYSKFDTSNKFNKLSVEEHRKTRGIEYFNWENICMYNYISEYVLKKYDKYINWYWVSYNYLKYNLKYSEKFVKEYNKKLYISKNLEYMKKRNEEILESNLITTKLFYKLFKVKFNQIQNVEFRNIFVYKYKISKGFIKTYANSINFDYLIQNPIFNEYMKDNDFFDLFIDKVIESNKRINKIKRLDGTEEIGFRISKKELIDND